MKKILFVFLFLLICAAKCDNAEIVAPIVPSNGDFEHIYTKGQIEKVMTDLDSLTTVYHLSGIPLDKWITLRMDKEYGYIQQKLLVSYSDTINVTIIYNTYVTVDSTFYQIKVRKLSHE